MMIGVMFWLLLAAAVFLLPLVLSISAFIRVRNVERRLDNLRALLRAGASNLGKGADPYAAPASRQGRGPAGGAEPPVDPYAPPRAETPPPFTPPASDAPSTPPASPVPEAPPAPPPAAWTPPVAPSRSFTIDWENFSFGKLLSWIGGFAFFLGAVFLAKYSIDHGWVTPAMRILGGLVLGAAAVGLGLRMASGYPVTGQTLAASGVAMLYAVTFAAHSLYQFIGSAETFAFLSLVTALAFLLAVRLDSQYIAILALAGGFLTPPLLSTGQDRAVGLFAYITLLDAGLLAVAAKKRWDFLWGLAAAGTIIMMAGWNGRYFAPEKMAIAAGIFIWFPALFSLALRKTDSGSSWALHATGLMALTSSLLGIAALGRIAGTPALPFLVLLAVGGIMAYMGLGRPVLARYHAGVGLITFLGLLGWTGRGLTAETLPEALAAYLLFGILHGAFAVVHHRRNGEKGVVLFGHLMPVALLVPLALGLVGSSVGMGLLWPLALLLNMVAIAAALATGFLWAVGLALVMSFFIVWTWLFRLPPAGMPGLMAVVAVFAALFVGVGAYLARSREKPGTAEKPGWGWPDEWTQYLPALSGVLPFFLLAAAAGRLRPEDPSSIFALSAILVLLLLGLTSRGGKALEIFPLVALGSGALVVYAWHNVAFLPDAAGLPLAWYAGFLALFLAAPFASPSLGALRFPWIAAAFAGPVFFSPIYRAYAALQGRDFIGLLPAVLAVVYLLGLGALRRRVAAEDPRSPGLSALFGGVGLFFISLIFPLQFDKQWVTLGWALEGVALVWLYGRIRHEGLKPWAVALLTLAFIRLTFNPAVFSYYPREEVRILNWYLYAYGIAAACQFAAAALWKNREGGDFFAKAPKVFNAFGGVLVFLLLNIEIADFFSTGSSLAFNFAGNLAQDLAYTLGWGLFGVALLLISLSNESKGARWSSFGLLLLSAGKLFMHDVWRLPDLYRVMAFGGTAVALITASFLFQRHVKKGGRP